MKKSIIILDGDLSGAQFVYALGVAQQLVEIGISTTLIGFDFSKTSDSYQNISGIDTICFCGLNSPVLSKLDYWENADKAVENIILYLESDPLVTDIMLFTGISTTYRDLIKFVLKKDFCCHIIAVEYPTVEIKELNSIRSIVNEFRVYKNGKHAFKLAKRLGNVICISKRMYSYFIKRGCNCLYLPHIMDIGSEQLRKEENRVNIIYCGYPGRKGSKDRLDLVIDAIVGSGLSGDRITLHIVGPTKETLVKQKCINTTITENDSRFIFHGYLSQMELKKLYSSMDYSILVRDIKNKTQYGYPTKVSESLAMGIPVICNITSDLGDVILDGKTGIVLDTTDKECVKKGILNAVEMKKNSIDMAENCLEIAFKTYALNSRKDSFRKYMGEGE